MGNLALSTVILVVLISPGLLLYSLLKVGATRAETASQIDISTIETILYGSVLSIPFHGCWSLLALVGAPVDYVLVLWLLQGGDRVWLDGAFANGAFLAWIFAYVFSQLLAALGTAWFLLSFSRRRQLDRYRSFHSTGAAWHLLFSGREKAPRSLWTWLWRPGFDVEQEPSLVLVTVGGVDQNLYRGILGSYELNGDGAIRRLVLQGAYRRPRRIETGSPPGTGAHSDGSADSNPPEKPNAPTARPNDPGHREAWREIPGENFVIECAAALTVTVDLFWEA